MITREIQAKSILQKYKRIDSLAIKHKVPKRKQGDYQIPEGFYHIDRFNPSYQMEDTK